jgi:curved DNA-binding protein CbpA
MGRVEELCAFVESVYPDLDLYSYYQLLEVEPDAAPDLVRAAFYRQAARLHPDRFAGLGDPAVRQKLTAIYARIAEAYKVLENPKKRAAYDAGLGEGQVRYAEQERERKGPQNPEDSVVKPEAKKFLRLALQAQRTGDTKGAFMNFKFALSYEPENAWLKEQLLRAENSYLKRGTLVPGARPR